MSFLRRRRPIEGLDEASCYERCHGVREGMVRVLEPDLARPSSPYWYWKRRPNPRVTGEDIRRQLLARLEARRPVEAGQDGAPIAVANGSDPEPKEPTVWAEGGSYERYIGRWSRRVAHELLGELGLPGGRRWLDVGCGTGALTETILEMMSPREVVGVDPSDGFVAYARSRVSDGRARFQVGAACELPFADRAFDAVVAGLVLNFVPEPERAVAEMARVGADGAVVGAYVWDYAGKMEIIRRFWEAATGVDPEAAELDEGQRFPICRPDELERVFRGAGLREVEAHAIDVPARFVDFEDYWLPFLGGQGPAGAYAVALADERRTELREALREALPFEPDGSLRLLARAWAVRGRR